MKKWLFGTTLLFIFLIIAIVIAADTNQLPRLLRGLIRFPGGDKAGHFILFGILSLLINKSAIALFPNQNPKRLVLTVSLLLSIMIGLEEWSQILYRSRTPSIIDLAASYMGVFIFAFLAYRFRR